MVPNIRWGYVYLSSLVWISRNHSWLIMLTFTLSTEILTSKELKEANKDQYIYKQVQGSLRNSEVIDAMGMGPNLKRLNQHADKALYLQGQASFKGGLCKVCKICTHDIAVVCFRAGSFCFAAGNFPWNDDRRFTTIKSFGTNRYAHWKLEGFTVARAQYNRLSELLSKYRPNRKP